jgi:hypothetical protein
MPNVTRGVGLSGLATLILLFAMATPAAAGGGVKVPTVQTPRITLTNAKTNKASSNTPLTERITLTNATVSKGTGSGPSTSKTTHP